MLEIWPDRAAISPLSEAALAASSAPDLIVGLAENANRRASRPTGRTFAGLADEDGDGRYETLLIFNSETATQPRAAAALRAFGAEDLLMLDGGGSTQLICQGRLYIASGRPIPQTLAVVGGPPQGTPGAAGRTLWDRFRAWWESTWPELGDELETQGRGFQRRLARWWREERPALERTLLERLQEWERRFEAWLEAQAEPP